MSLPAILEPLTPSDCDVRSFEFMPLSVARLRDSAMVRKVSAEGFRAAVLLWCAAWHQVPAASLPDDDAELAGLAGYGFAVGMFTAIRDEALYGFVKCSDGRLYHRVISDKAVEAWGKSRKQKAKAESRWSKARSEAAADAAASGDHAAAHAAAMQQTGTGTPEGEDKVVPSDEGVAPVEECEEAFGDEFKLAPEPATVDAADVVRTWNALAERCDFPMVKKLTEERRKAIRARLAEHGAESWALLLEKVEASPFAREEWKPGLDAVLQKSTFLKFIEGNYDGRRFQGGRGTTGAGPDGRRAERDDRVGSMLEGAVEALDRHRRER